MTQYCRVIFAFQSYPPSLDSFPALQKSGDVFVHGWFCDDFENKLCKACPQWTSAQNEMKQWGISVTSHTLNNALSLLLCIISRVVWCFVWWFTVCYFPELVCPEVLDTKMQFATDYNFHEWCVFNLFIVTWNKRPSFLLSLVLFLYNYKQWLVS